MSYILSVCIVMVDALKRLMETTPLVVAGRQFRSRLLLGTGRFSSHAVMQKAIEASRVEIVTIALRRVDLSGKKDPFATIL